MTSGSQGLINQIRDNKTQRKSKKKKCGHLFCTTRCPAYSYNSPKKIFATSVMFPQLSHLKIFSGSCSIIKQYETKKRLPPSKEIDKYRTEKKKTEKKTNNVCNQIHLVFHRGKKNLQQYPKKN